MSLVDYLVRENAGDRTDTVHPAVSYTLGANVENLKLTGAGNHAATAIL